MLDRVFEVPHRLAGRFERRAQGLTAEADYRLTHSLVPSVRYDWMKAGGFKSDVIFEPGPRQSQVLHLQMRWYVFEGDDLARVPAPALLALSLRDSINLTPGDRIPSGRGGTACSSASIWPSEMRIGAVLVLVLGLARSAAADPATAVYNHACSWCHGKDGRGDGPAAFSINKYRSPRPRDFTRGRFKLRSTPAVSCPPTTTCCAPSSAAFRATCRPSAASRRGSASWQSWP